MFRSIFSLPFIIFLLVLKLFFATELVYRLIMLFALALQKAFNCPVRIKYRKVIS